MTCEQLSEMYQRWLERNGLALGSADEHLKDENLTEDQRDFLRLFCLAWDAAQSKS